MSLLVPNGCARFKSLVENEGEAVTLMGQLTNVNTADGLTTVSFNPLVPCPVHQMHLNDPRLNVVPHLKLATGQQQSIVVSQYACEAILVVHAKFFLTNVLIYREGMTCIYAIGWQCNQSVSPVQTSAVSEEQFPCMWGYASVSASQLDFNTVRTLQMNQVLLDAPFELYKFRHALASEIQKHLRSSRGRRLSVSFSFQATLRSMSVQFV